MKVGVIGTGHVGLVTAATLASFGHEVSAVDSDAEKIDMLRRGEPPFFEPGLPELVDEQVAAGRLAFEYESKAVLPGAEVVMICVGTPRTPTARPTSRPSNAPRWTSRATPATASSSGQVDGSGRDRRSHPLDLRARSSRREVPPRVQPRVPPPGDRRSRFPRARPTPGRGGRRRGVRRDAAPLRAAAGARRPPDRDRRGDRRAVQARLERLPCAQDLLRQRARPHLRARGRRRRCRDPRHGTDPRIGPAFLGAGLGYGGYCFPKDLAAFERLAERLGYPFPMLAEVARINDEAVEAVVDAFATKCVSSRARGWPSSDSRSSRGPTTSAGRRRLPSRAGPRARGGGGRVRPPSGSERQGRAPGAPDRDRSVRRGGRGERGRSGHRLGRVPRPRPLTPPKRGRRPSLRRCPQRDGRPRGRLAGFAYVPVGKQPLRPEA